MILVTTRRQATHIKHPACSDSDSESAIDVDVEGTEINDVPPKRRLSSPQPPFSQLPRLLPLPRLAPPPSY